MEQIEQSIPEPAYPNPPRWWWTKRIIIIAMVLVFGLGIAWKWWEHQVHLRIEAEIAAIRARGEPLDLADFDAPPVSDARNATLSILAAISSIPTVETNFVASLSARMTISPTTANDRQGMERVAKASTVMRSFARTARFQPDVLWSTNPIRRSSEWANQTQLSRFMLVNALHEHLAGHDAEAIEIVRDMLFHVDSLEQAAPNLLLHLIALAIGATTFEATGDERNIRPLR